MRVNDYNPLLLYVWKANIDIQFVGKSSLALAHHVSGYVTGVEKSNLQEIWQDIIENKSIYSRLWSFGVRSLRFRECGLYEAADLLLGDHLTEKSCTVQWVDVSRPQKQREDYYYSLILIFTMTFLSLTNVTCSFQTKMQKMLFEGYQMTAAHCSTKGCKLC